MIVLAYHGGGSDPMQYFSGNSIMGLLGLNAYPTGIVDRKTGIISRGSWLINVNNRQPVSAPVEITMDRSYNFSNRELTVNLNFTADESISGDFRFNVILVEDGIVWTQNGTLGGANYVHDWTVQAMLNGATGESIVNGAWDTGVTHSFDRVFTLPVPQSPLPDIVPENCRVAVIVYKYATPLASSGEIQQGFQMNLAPVMSASMASTSPDIMGDGTANGAYSAEINNTGELSDTYYINVDFSGPEGWSGEFSVNGNTHNPGELDSLMLDAGASAAVDLSIIPTTAIGFGEITVNFQSKERPDITGSRVFRYVNGTGLEVLVIDGEEESYEYAPAATLENLGINYGIVSKNVFGGGSPDLSSFRALVWTSSNSAPVFSEADVAALQIYIENGGHLLLTGQDIGKDISASAGTSTHALSFYNNILHAKYIADKPIYFTMNGVLNDPISNGMSIVLNDEYPKSPDVIQPFDNNAEVLFKVGVTSYVSGLRIQHGDARIVYTTFSMEQITEPADRDTLMARCLNWFDGEMSGMDEGGEIPQAFDLAQNYPNPFNPSTTIEYSLPQNAEVSLAVYNLLGQEVSRLVSNENQPAGTRNVVWNGRNSAGEAMPSGVYVYQLRARSVSGESFAMQKKMILMK
jgi:hypothetical protein